MSTDILPIVTSIPDSQPAAITLTDSTGRSVHLSCVFKESEAPSFFLLFPPGTIPKNIEEKRSCMLASHDVYGEAVTFAAKVIQVLNNRVVELEAQQAIRPEDLREYFRVNIKVQVAVFYDPGESEADEQPLELEGQTVDISQTGVLTILSAECRAKKPVTIEIDLPNPSETIICSGCVIRSKRIRKNHWLTAFHFDNISSRSREIIAKNCFAEQRRQLRENIQTAG